MFFYGLLSSLVTCLEWTLVSVATILIVWLLMFLLAFYYLFFFFSSYLAKLQAVPLPSTESATFSWLNYRFPTLWPQIKSTWSGGKTAVFLARPRLIKLPLLFTGLGVEIGAEIWTGYFSWPNSINKCTKKSNDYQLPVRNMWKGS